MTLKEQIARDLLSIKAVFFRPDEPFTWASGIKSPVYCDNRLTLTAPEVRNHVENGLVSVVREYYPQAEVLMGTSTAGIAHAAITAHIMGIPMGYVRSEIDRIEGKIDELEAENAALAEAAGYVSPEEQRSVLVTPDISVLKEMLGR